MHSINTTTKIVIGIIALAAIALFCYIFGVGLSTLLGAKDNPCNCECNSSMASSSSTLGAWVSLGNKALEGNAFDSAIVYYSKAGDTALVTTAKQKAVEHCYEQAVTQKDIESKLQWLKKVKTYGGYASTDEDIAEVEKQIAAAEKVVSKPPQQLTRPTKSIPQPQQTAQPASACENATILITSGAKRRYSKGDKFTVVAKSGNGVCQDGYWQYEAGIWTGTQYANPAQFEITSVPPSGEVKLRYMVGGKTYNTLSLSITP